MKKSIAMLMCLALLLGCVAAAAETAPEYTGELTVSDMFTVKWIAPEIYSVSEIQSNAGGFMLLALLPDDDHADEPMMMVSIAPDELLYEVERLNDLDEAALAQIEATFREEDEVDISYMETAYGTKLMVVKETRGGIDYVDFYTIYKGYEIELVLTQTELKAGTPITEEQIATVIQFLSDMEFAPVQ